jgi:tetratricopeptide (TPR) repeat protein
MAGQSAPVAPEAMRHNNLGVGLMDSGPKDPEYFAEAIKEFQSALQIAPHYLIAEINSGMAYYYAGQREKGLAVLKEALKEAPDNPYISYMLGLILETFGNYAEAREYFLKVARLDPIDSKTWYHIGNCYSKEQQYSEAIAPLRRAAGIEPYQRLFRYNLFMALNRAGKADEAQIELASFQKLEQSSVKVAPPPKSSLEYLRQGKYAEAIAESLPLQAPSPKVPQYTDVAVQLGVNFKHEGPGNDPELQKLLRGEPIPRSWYTNETNRKKLVAALSGGVAFCDYNNDGKLDLFLLGPNGQHALMEQQADGKFVDVTIQHGFSDWPSTAVSCTWGDYDSDGWSDLFVVGYGTVRLYRNVKGNFQDVTAATGMLKSVQPDTWCLTTAFADVDHDGDLDIYVGNFTDLAEVPEKQEIRFPADFAGQPNLLFRNNSDGTFTDITSEAKADGGTHQTRGVWFSDVNMDRAIDLVLFDAAGKPTVYLNASDGTFALSNQPPSKGPTVPPLGVWLAYGDFNGDGAVDEAKLTNGAMALLNRNDSRPQNWLRVRPDGYAVPGKVKSNKLGIGTKIEVRSIGKWEIKELHAGNGAGGCDEAEVYFDLGDQKRMDFVRAIFPSGVRKTLRDVGANQTVKLEEPLLDVNSCPTVFAWNGMAFEFIADTIGAGILGELVTPGQFSQPDPDEWLRVSSEQLKPSVARTYDFRWANPLEEVTYLDNVRLIAVDHPAQVEVFTNERMVNEMRNRFPVQLYGVTQARPLVKAIDQHGHDVTRALEKVDRNYFDHFSMLPFKGFAKEWSLKLDLGVIRPEEKPVLLLNSWSYWNSSASIIAASQAGQRLWGPVLEVQGVDGDWRVGIEDMGVSAGLPRTILLDLTPVLRTGEHVVRIRSNRTLYYDQILVANRKECREITRPADHDSLMESNELQLTSGELHWLGYPKRALPDGELPEMFDYSQIESHSEWGTHEGMLTRYGDVRPLLKQADDQFVVMEHGEEVAVSFDARRLPLLPHGWKRTFFFYSSGFEKGYELHSAHSQTVGPLPFQGMESYPNDRIRDLSDVAFWEYLLEWNTRPSFLRR